MSEYDFEFSEKAIEAYKLRTQERQSALKEMRAWSAMFHSSTGRLSFDDLLAIPTDTCFRALRAGELIQWLTLVAAHVRSAVHACVFPLWKLNVVRHVACLYDDHMISA